MRNISKVNFSDLLQERERETDVSHHAGREGGREERQLGCQPESYCNFESWSKPLWGPIYAKYILHLPHKLKSELYVAAIIIPGQQ